ncbi:chemotaxis protein CheA [Pelagicoccus sp. SDUM812003]|uniref:chemotaxis protein CheA n=1 Tax=Pelagicoccus sp. SDUM812003 TaxID=3041267 RepID=UPI00280E772F|nr:chemotaxis protein CheA [Pelagicoccus sp. SDUM812003]MDQ8203873.1 chemotaxis protein CheA [Pelagicoccus sp. SDUM812003]
MSSYDPTQTFLLEAEDLLTLIEQSALDLKNQPADREALDLLFRSFHTLKGSGSMFGFEEVAAFTHHIETSLESVRDSGELPPAELVPLILSSIDEIKRLLAGEKSEQQIEIATQLASLSPSKPSGAPQDKSAKASPPDKDTANTRYRIAFTPPIDIGSAGLDPASLLDELRELGDCTVSVDTSRIPPIDQLAPDSCHLSWEILLRGECDERAIRDVFIFVEDDCQLAIETIDSTPVSRPKPAPNTCQDLLQRKNPIAQGTARVASEKLDQLVSLVGELVMNQSRLTQVASKFDSSELNAPVEEIERLASELRDSVLGIRMTPIGSTFNRFRRLVHDLSMELGKETVLNTEGEDTELDKTVIDQLGDPLVHLIRNSIDHGIESPSERAARGKPKAGAIKLSARHEGTHVIVSIEDDGRGLNEEKIRQKAIEKKLVDPDARLSDNEIHQLIFRAGFSTAENVTNVSGRGVGMDVVKRQIEALGGSLKVFSSWGQGTRIDLTLPLTLAIIDGMLVEVAGDRFILPMSAVTENVEITREERCAKNGRNLVNVRGELVPYIRLRDLFEEPSQGPDAEKVVITRFDGNRLGFVVDRVLGSHQTVIQSLGKVYETIEVVSGATIMGDGRVALILDLPSLVQHDRSVSQIYIQNH